MRRVAPWLVACIIGALWLVVSPPGANDLAGGDEGYYGTMARNVLAARGQLLSPGLSPLGPPGDKPPLYPLLIAPFVRLWGATPAAVRAPSALCAAAIAGGLGALLGSAAAPGCAVFASALLASLPWFADASRGAAAELPLTALATLALLLLAPAPRSLKRAMGAGVLLGLAFLCKLWLVAPAALAAAAMVGGRTPDERRALGLMVATALAVGSIHLIAVAAFQPRAFDHWRYVYLGRSLVERVGGEGYAGYWRLPLGAYWAWVTHAFVLVLPLVAVGAETAARRRAEPVPRALLVWTFGVLLLSVFRVKSAAYLYVVLPPVAGLASLGLDAILRGVRPSALSMALGALLTSPLVARWGAQGLSLAAWAAAWLAGGLLVALARVPRLRVEWAAAAWALLAVALGGARSATRLHARYHTPGYQRVAAAMSPRLADVPPDRPCFLAPEVPAFGFHLFRTGRYWGTPLDPWTPERLDAVRGDRRLRVFVVDPSRSLYGGWPDSATVIWLERETREVTAETPAGPRGERPLRVFVR